MEAQEVKEYTVAQRSVATSFFLTHTHQIRLVAHSPSVERLLRPFSTTCPLVFIVAPGVAPCSPTQLPLSTSSSPSAQSVTSMSPHHDVLYSASSLSFVTTSLWSRHSYHIIVPHYRVPRQYVWVCHDMLLNKMVGMDVTAHLGSSVSTRSRTETNNWRRSVQARVSQWGHSPGTLSGPESF